jgi:hypothetical protein
MPNPGLNDPDWLSGAITLGGELPKYTGKVHLLGTRKPLNSSGAISVANASSVRRSRMSSITKCLYRGALTFSRSSENAEIWIGFC